MRKNTTHLHDGIRLSVAALLALLFSMPAIADEPCNGCRSSSPTLSSSTAGTNPTSDSPDSASSEDGEDAQGEDPDIDEVNPDPFTSDPKSSSGSFYMLLLKLFGIF